MYLHAQSVWKLYVSTCTEYCKMLLSACFACRNARDVILPWTIDVYTHVGFKAPQCAANTFILA